MSLASFDFSQLTKYKEQIEKLDDKQRQNLMEDCTKQVAAAVLEGAYNNTQVVTGTLRRGWTMGKKIAPRTYVMGQKVSKFGSTYSLTETNYAVSKSVKNSQFYASYVEYGHRGKNGVGWVKGYHMLQMAEDDVAKQQKRIISLKVNKELKKYFGGDG